MLRFTQFGPFDLREGSWETEREVYGKRVIDTIAEYCSGFDDSVEHVEVLAPPDLEERYGLIGGNIMQDECRWTRCSASARCPATATTGRRSPGSACVAAACTRAVACRELRRATARRSSRRNGVA